MVVSSETNIGKVRSINQDACFISTGVPSYIVVADGMGGHKAGEVASSVAVECIKSFLTPEKIKGSENHIRILRKLYRQTVDEHSEKNYNKGIRIYL